MERLNREIVVFGEHTIEILYNDGTTPYRARNDIEYSHGCFHKNSVVSMPTGVIFLDNRKRVHHISLGYQVSYLSDSIQEELDEINSAEVIHSSYVRLRGRDYYILYLSGRQHTFVYDMTTRIWTRWDKGGEGFSIKQSSYDTENGVFVFIDLQGNIKTLTPGQTTDDGDAIEMSFETYYLGRGRREFYKQTRHVQVDVEFPDDKIDFSKVTRFKKSGSESNISLIRTTDRGNVSKKTCNASGRAPYKFFIGGSYKKARYELQISAKTKTYINKSTEYLGYASAI